MRNRSAPVAGVGVAAGFGLAAGLAAILGLGAIVGVPASAPAPGLVLNEVLYDPEGPDTGLEFVEIAASGGELAGSLHGWSLETGNGVGEGEWTVAWVGSAGDSLAGGLFVVGEERVQPLPHALVTLDLQNGPDACRLRGPSGEADVLGWGSPLPAGFYEGSPAEDVSGLALARRPDGRDTGSNERDFVPAAPSPARFNVADSALVLRVFPPPPGKAGAAWDLEWELENVGRVGLAPDLALACAVHPGERLVAFPAGFVSSGATRSGRFTAWPPPGAHLPAPPGGGSSSMEDAGLEVTMLGAGVEGTVWVGLGEDLLVNEALTRPEPGEPEWLEVLGVGARSVDAAAFRLEDAGGTRAALSGVVSPGELVVLAQDSARVAARYRVPGRVVHVSPWPSLNHGGSSEEAAEHVALQLGDRAVASAALPGGGPVAVSWERISRHLDPQDPASFAPSLDPGGATPGRSNSRHGDRTVPPSSAHLSVHPSPFRPARHGSAVFVIRPPAPRDALRVFVHDLEGHELRELPAWRAGEQEHRALWDGTDASGAPVSLGVYVVRVVAEGNRPARASVTVLR